MRLVTALAVLACCAAAVPAGAQATFGQVRAEGSPTVYVTEHSGQETRGQLVTFSESEITIKTGTVTKTFTADQVSLIERRGDSLKNGAIAGVAFGVLFALFAASEGCSGRQNGCRVGFFLFGEALYGAIGAGIDALIPGRTRIWPGKPGKGTGITVSFSPGDHRAFVGWRQGIP
jgi:hypothetical protein